MTNSHSILTSRHSHNVPDDGLTCKDWSLHNLTAACQKIWMYWRETVAVSFEIVRITGQVNCSFLGNRMSNHNPNNLAVPSPA